MLEPVVDLDATNSISLLLIYDGVFQFPYEVRAVCAGAVYLASVKWCLSLGALSVCLVSVLTNVSNELSVDESCFLFLGDFVNVLVATSVCLQLETGCHHVQSHRRHTFSILKDQ